MKKSISFILIILLVLTSGSIAFAANGANEFTGDEIKMTLDDVKKMMLTSSTAIETANYNLKMDKAKTRGYYENVNNLNSLYNASKAGELPWGISSPSRTQREMIDLASEFAKAQTQNNYDAEVNQILRDTVDTYYKVLQAKESLKISQDNVTIQEKLYNNTQSKFKLGVVSKQDVLKAEIGYNEAKVNAEKAENALASAKMGFNLLIGFDLMQNVTLTEPLTESPLSEVSLADAIAKGLASRNEITGAAFGLKSAELTLKETGNTVSKSSSKYMNAQAALMSAQAAAKNAPGMVEMDIRDKYMTMVQKKSEVELGKLNVANAKEAYRLANLQYDAGMATLTDAQQAQIGSYQTELGYSATVLEYNLAVMAYEQAMTVGTVRISLGQ